MTRGGSCRTRSTGPRGYRKWSQSYSKRHCTIFVPGFSFLQEPQHKLAVYLKTYSVFYERLQITDYFGSRLDARDSLTQANIEVPIILSLSWLQHHNLLLNFDPMTIQWRDSSSLVTDSIEESLDLRSLTQIPTDFQVIQLQLETLDESLEEPTIPKTYKDLENVFLPSNANSLPQHRDEYHAIELEPGKTPSFGPLYNLSEYQLKTLREYIDKNLANRIIWPHKSSARALVLFTPKPDGTLRLCVDYHGLNSMKIKNRYVPPLINEILDRLSDAPVFMKIDVKNAYYNLRIREVNQWKTAFRTRYGLFEYRWCYMG